MSNPCMYCFLCASECRRHAPVYEQYEIEGRTHDRAKFPPCPGWCGDFVERPSSDSQQIHREVGSIAALHNTVRSLSAATLLLLRKSASAEGWLASTERVLAGGIEEVLSKTKDEASCHEDIDCRLLAVEQRTRTLEKLCSASHDKEQLRPLCRAIQAIAIATQLLLSKTFLAPSEQCIVSNIEKATGDMNEYMGVEQAGRDADDSRQ